MYWFIHKSVVRIDTPNVKFVILSNLRFHLKSNYITKNRSGLDDQSEGF